MILSRMGVDSPQAVVDAMAGGAHDCAIFFAKIHGWLYCMGLPPCLIWMAPVVGGVAHDRINTRH